MTNSCIRVYADEAQINACREAVELVSPSLPTLSKALNMAGNEVRLKILFLLHKDSKLCVCDLSDVLQMKIPAISQHLRKMEDAGIITSKKVAQTIFHELTPEYQNVLTPIFHLLEGNKVMSMA